MQRPHPERPSAVDLVAVPEGWADAVGPDAALVLGPRTTLWEYGDDDIAWPSAWTDVQALVPGDRVVDVPLLDLMPRLRVIGVDGTGVDAVDVDAATRRGVAVCNVRDYASDAVAEFTFGLLIALQRHIPTAHAAVRAGQWPSGDLVGKGLRGQTLGLVGLGSIGTRVAELARAFGMDVLCTTAHPDPRRVAPSLLHFVDLPELLSTSDVISLHLALRDDTRGMIGAAQLSAVRPGAVFINTARGGLVDEVALVDALRAGRLGGAALDVTDTEPIRPDSPLLELDNVLITPHIAAATDAALRGSFLGCLQHIQDFFEGQPRCVVNPEVLEQR